MSKKGLSFWRWFFGLPEPRAQSKKQESSGQSGFRKLFDRWSIPGAVVSLALAYFLTEDVQEMGKAVILPLIGILSALCFAWGASAMALLQTDEVRLIVDKRGKGLDDYAYHYQSAILLTFFSLSCWGLMSFGLFNSGTGVVLPSSVYAILLFLAKSVLFFLLVVTIRESWSVVNFTQALLIAHYRVKAALDSSRSKERE